jgi:hypothetical protein
VTIVQFRSFPADHRSMIEWLWRLSRAVAGEPAPSREVIRAVAAARAKSSDVWVSLLDGDTSQPMECAARISRVERRGLRLLQHGPVGADDPLLPLNASIRLSISTPYGRLVGRSRVHSRELLASKSGIPSVEYLVAIPETLQAFNRRAGSRATLGGPVVVEAELRRQHDDLAEPIRGSIGTLTPHRAVIRARNADGRVAAGQRLFFTAHLPDPVGEIAEMATVDDIEAQGQFTLVHLRFLTPIVAIEAAAHDDKNARQRVA